MNQAIFTGVFVTIGIYIFGYISMRLRFLTEETTQKMTDWILDFLFPILVFKTIAVHFEFRNIIQVSSYLFLGFLIVVFGAVIGFCACKILKITEIDSKKMFIHCCAVNNYGYLPIMILKEGWTDKELSLLFILMTGTLIAHWTIGVFVLSKPDKKTILTHTFSPTLIAVFFGLLVNYTHLNSHLPVLMYKILKEIGDLAVPLVLIVIGASFNFQFNGRMIRTVILLSIFRLFLIPWALWSVTFLPQFPTEMKWVWAIVSFMPVAASAPLFANRFGGSLSLASGSVILTTFLSVFTVPWQIALLPNL